MEKTDKKIEVGTVLYLVPSNTSVRRYGKDVKKAAVSKVARKYIYVDVDKDVYDAIKLNKNNLECIDTFNGERLWKAYTSMEEIENAKEKETLLKQFGQLFSLYGKGNQLALEQLRAIKDIVGGELLK